MKYIFTLLFLSISYISSIAQTYFLENFEKSGSEIPAGWSQEAISFDMEPAYWEFKTGGQPLADTTMPDNAYSGKYNAFFDKFDPSAITRLITKPIDLKGSIKPEMSFMLFMREAGYTDNLKIYMREHEDSAWFLTKSYLEPVPSWTEMSFNVPSEFHASEMQIAFEGISNVGGGIVVDSIEITERGVIPMHLRDYKINSVSTAPMPFPSDNNGMIRIEFDAFGNSGKLKLKGLTLNSGSTTNQESIIDSVKLFYSEFPYYDPTKNLGGESGYTGETVELSGLDYEIPYGKSYVWITYDLNGNAMQGDIIDLAIAAEGLDIVFDSTGVGGYDGFNYVDDSIEYTITTEESGTQTFVVPHYYKIPQVDINPDAVRLAFEPIFYDDFESSSGWSLQGDMEIDSVKGLGSGYHGNPDPDYAISGAKVLGTDLTDDGDYIASSNDTIYHAQTSFFDLSDYRNLSVQYYYYINLELFDYVKVLMSVDSGNTWKTIKNYPSRIDQYWLWEETDISSHGANRRKNVGFRIEIYNDGAGLGSIASGVNIDNFTLVGDKINRDAGVTGIIEPVNGCITSDNDRVKVQITNLGADNLEGTIPVGYSLDGGENYVKDTLLLTQPLRPDSSITFTFSQDISDFDGNIFTFKSKTFLPGDEYPDNDISEKSIILQPVINEYMTENFEEHQGLWVAYGDSMAWDWGLAYPEYEELPPSGYNAWVTHLGQNYKNLEKEYVESPCIDLNGLGRVMISLHLRHQLQDGVDGAKVQYSDDYGVTWQDLDTNELNVNWGWYDAEVTALAGKGWTGNSDGWEEAKQLLPAELSDAEMIKLRIKFATDGNLTDKGIVFDDFSLLPTPDDVGVSSFVNMNDTCLNTLPSSVKVSVQNYGLNPLKENDTIILGLDLNASKVVVDTFYLSNPLQPGDSVIHTFSVLPDFNASGGYNLRAYTLIESDPLFYASSNDTSEILFDVYPLPGINLPNTIPTREPDTTVLRPTFSYDYEYLWEDGSTDSVFAVPFQGVYAVTVTDVGGYGCVNSDSTFVELLFNDAGTDSVLYPISACERGENENPVIRIRNFGNDTIWAGESFIAAFEVIGDTIIKDTFNIAANLIPDQTIEYAFEKTLDFSKDTTYQLRTFTDYSGDTIALNDTTYNSFEVFGYPVVDIGPDTTLRALSYTLNANEGFATYQWSDETTDANLMVNESGKYYVEVYDTNGCPAYDTAHVRLIIRDVMPVSMTSPVNGCVNASQSVSLDVVNTGNDTIYQDDTVKISVFMNQALWGKYDQILQTDFIPDETRQFNLNDEIMFADSGNYSFTLTSTTSLDLIKINDTIYESITINGIPDVEFNDAVNDTIKSFSDGANLSVGNYENYVWSNGQTNPTLVVKEEGWYSVEVEDDNGCEGTGEVFVLLNVVSVDRVADSRNMVFYPNPAVDWLNVTVFPVNHGGKMILEVFTDTGEIVHSDIVSIKGETQIELNVSEYASGLYILRLRDHKTIINKKFIIK